MRHRGNTFTEKEDELILNTLSNDDKCLNLSQTFRELSEVLNRDSKAIASRWYYKLRYTKHSFNLKSKKEQTPNVKNKKDKTYINTTDMVCNRKVKSFEPFLKHLFDKNITECGSNKLYSLYTEFCENNNYFPYTQKEFITALLLKGFQRRRLKDGVIYKFVENNTTNSKNITHSNKSIDAILHLIERLSYSEKESLTYKLIYEL